MHIQCVSAVSCYLCSCQIDLYAVTPVPLNRCSPDGNSLFLFGLFPQVHTSRVKFQTRTYSIIVISKVNLSLVRSDAESTSVCLMCPFDILAFDIPSTGRGQVDLCNAVELFYVFVRYAIEPRRTFVTYPVTYQDLLAL